MSEPASATTTDLGDDLERAESNLREFWGHEALRPMQRQAVTAVLEGRDTLLVLPTGGGKSVCYQLPPLVRDRPAIVLSPLVSLMKDQVDSLRASGVPAAALHGLLSEEENRQVLRDFVHGRVPVLYLAPERLALGPLLEILSAADPCLIAIDEAHCISQWGHDFRPDYRRLADIRAQMPDVPMLACTATATPRVRDDIVEQLQLADPVRVVGSVDRPNLIFRVKPRTDVISQILDVLKGHPGDASIIYVQTRAETERIAKRLVDRGIQAACYHAGLPATKRAGVHERFQADQLPVVVATVAFGMGIDRSDVRCVIHANMPKSLEHYQQEAGRAGRDGLSAECVLLHAASDAARWQSLIERSAEDAIADGGDPTLVAKNTRAQLDLLAETSAWCRGLGCRHRAVVEYFGHEWNGSDAEEGGCGACDACLGEIERLEDATTVARKILSCVARLGTLGQQFGAGHLADIMVGGNTERIRSMRHDELSTFGLLKDLTKSQVTDLIGQLTALGCLERTGGDRPVLTLATDGVPVLRGEREVELAKPARGRNSRERPAATGRDAADFSGVDRTLFEELRARRRELAATKAKPAYVIATDAVLRDLARARPSSVESMAGIRGLGRRKLAEFGPSLLEVLDDWDRDHGGGRDRSD